MESFCSKRTYAYYGLVPVHWFLGELCQFLDSAIVRDISKKIVSGLFLRYYSFDFNKILWKSSLSRGHYAYCGLVPLQVLLKFILKWFKYLLRTLFGNVEVRPVWSIQSSEWRRVAAYSRWVLNASNLWNSP